MHRNTATALVLVLAALAAICTGDSRIRRLPRAVWPTQYALSLRTNLQGTNFTGNVTIDMEVREDTKNITLHAKDLNLKPVTLLTESNNSAVYITSQHYKGSLLTFHINSTLKRGSKVTLQIPFSGLLNPSRQRGYYRVKTGGGDTDWLSGTVFEFDHAREAFPCFDEPEFKAQFRISLVHHKNHTALSNMPLVSSHNLNERDWVVDNFDNTPLISSYLVAYHLLKADFRETNTDNGRPLKVWTSAKELQWTNNTLEVAPRVLSLLEQFTGLLDPMPKQDLVAVPRFQGALENWGVMSFMPSGLLSRPGRKEGLLQQVFRTKLLTHEMSHTWFGNLVTPQWWDSLWLSEGAATFITSLIIDQMEPMWDQLDSDTEEHLTTTFLSNAVSSPGQALSHPVEWSRQLRTVSSAPYFKGFSLIRMLYYILGKEKFQEGIQRYLSELQYNTTTPRQFYQAMQYTYEEQELPELMNSWTHHSGLPVVSMNRSDGQLILSQERFFMNLFQSEEELETVINDTTWWIPVSFVSNSGKSFEDAKPVFWFNVTNITINDPETSQDWLILNKQAAGTYHVRYDKANLELIKTALRNSSLDDIPPLNRFQLVLDYGMFGLAGLEPLDEVLDLMDYLSREQHVAPWAAGIKIFWRMNQRLRNTQGGFRLQDKVRELIAPEFARLGIQSHKDDTLPVLRHRTQIVQQACFYQLSDCLVSAGRLFSNWVNKPQPDKVNPIPRDVRLSVYCTVMKFGGLKYFKFLQERALTSRDQVQRDTMFTGLGCSNKYHLLYGLMENYLGNSTTTKRDFTKLLQGLIQYNNDIGPVLKFMNSTMVKLKSASKKKLRWSQTMLKDLSQQIYTKEQLNVLMNMMALSKSSTTTDMTGIVHTVEHNSRWREKYKNINMF